MNWKKRVGIGLIVAGIFAIVAARVITGAVIGFRRGNLLGVFGILALIFGVVLVFLGRKIEDIGSLVDREDDMVVDASSRFLRDIKGHQLGPIIRAIRNINTGKGKEERLRGVTAYAIRAGGGERVVYNKGHDSSGRVVVHLMRYLPAHEYERLTG